MVVWNLDELNNFLNGLRFSIENIQISDILDILIVAFLIYTITSRIHSTSSARVAKGIIFLLLATLITDVLSLHVLNYIMNMILSIGFIALVIVFQPELRRLLEKLGGKGFVSYLFGNKSPLKDTEKAILSTVSACEIMSKEKIGVLLIFERHSTLEEYFKTGTVIDAKASEQLLRNLFFPKASLHDGAVIIRNGRIAAAGCVMPLSENPNLNSDLGTRHRAAVGTSEVSDAIAVIVSEETGTISVAIGGMLKRHLAPQTLEKLLLTELVPKEEEQKSIFARGIEAFTKRNKKNAK